MDAVESIIFSRDARSRTPVSSCGRGVVRAEPICEGVPHRPWLMGSDRSRERRLHLDLRGNGAPRWAAVCGSALSIRRRCRARHRSWQLSARTASGAIGRSHPVVRAHAPAASGQSRHTRARSRRRSRTHCPERQARRCPALARRRALITPARTAMIPSTVSSRIESLPPRSGRRPPPSPSIGPRPDAPPSPSEVFGVNASTSSTLRCSVSSASRWAR